MILARRSYTLFSTRLGLFLDMFRVVCPAATRSCCRTSRVSGVTNRTFGNYVIFHVPLRASIALIVRSAWLPMLSKEGACESSSNGGRSGSRNLRSYDDIPVSLKWAHVQLYLIVPSTVQRLPAAHVSVLLSLPSRLTLTSPVDLPLSVLQLCCRVCCSCVLMSTIP